MFELFLDRFLSSFDWKEFACGSGAACLNISVMYPAYKMIFRQMLHGVHATNAFDQLRHEGLTYLYRGILPPLAQRTISLSIMFGVFDGARRFLVEDIYMNAYAAKVVAGIGSGTIEATLLPFERVQTLLAHSKYHRHFKNTPQAFRYVWVNHGFWELYRGIVPVLCRNGPSNAMFFIIREELYYFLPQRLSASTRTAQEFLAGAFFGSFVSALYYPLNVIKVAMQSEMGHKSQSMWSVSKQIYHERGSRVSRFYRGCAINSGRAFMSWGIMNVAYENIKKQLS